MVKNPPASAGDAGDAGDAGSIPGVGRPPGEGNGYPLQHSCLGNPMDRGAWRATVHAVEKSQTQRSDRGHSAGLWDTVSGPPVQPQLVVKYRSPLGASVVSSVQ